MCEFNNRNAIFLPTARPTAAQKREIWGCIFNLRKLRQIGEVNNKGNPHLYRNGGRLIDIIGWSVISDGVGIKTVRTYVRIDCYFLGIRDGRYSSRLAMLVDNLDSI